MNAKNNTTNRCHEKIKLIDEKNYCKIDKNPIRNCDWCKFRKILRDVRYVPKFKFSKDSFEVLKCFYETYDEALYAILCDPEGYAVVYGLESPVDEPRALEIPSTEVQKVQVSPSHMPIVPYNTPTQPGPEWVLTNSCDYSNFTCNDSTIIYNYPDNSKVIKLTQAEVLKINIMSATLDLGCQLGNLGHHGHYGTHGSSPAHDLPDPISNYKLVNNQQRLIFATKSIAEHLHGIFNLLAASREVVKLKKIPENTIKLKTKNVNSKIANEIIPNLQDLSKITYPKEMHTVLSLYLGHLFKCKDGKSFCGNGSKNSKGFDGMDDFDEKNENESPRSSPKLNESPRSSPISCPTSKCRSNLKNEDDAKARYTTLADYCVIKSIPKILDESFNIESIEPNFIQILNSKQFSNSRKIKSFTYILAAKIKFLLMKSNPEMARKSRISVCMHQFIEDASKVLEFYGETEAIPVLFNILRKETTRWHAFIFMCNYDSATGRYHFNNAHFDILSIKKKLFTELQTPGGDSSSSPGHEKREAQNAQKYQTAIHNLTYINNHLHKLNDSLICMFAGYIMISMLGNATKIFKNQFSDFLKIKNIYEMQLEDYNLGYQIELHEYACQIVRGYIESIGLVELLDNIIEFLEFCRDLHLFELDLRFKRMLRLD